MADQPTNDLEIVNPDAGLSFRAEMFMNNFIMGYWKLIVGVIVTVLVLILVYGNYQSMYRSGQYETSDRTAWVLRQVSKEYPNLLAPGGVINPYTIYLTPPMSVGEDEEMLKNAIIAANELRTIGDEGAGAAAAQAYLLSAEFFRLAGQADERAVSLQKASETGAGIVGGPLGLMKAAAVRQGGDIDGALAALDETVTSNKGSFVGEWALLERARLLNEVGRKDEAKSSLDTLVSEYPEGKLKDTATGELERMGFEAPTALETGSVSAPEPVDDAADEGGNSE